MLKYFSNIKKNEQIVSWGQAVRVLLVSLPIFALFLIASGVIVLGTAVLAGFVGQGGHGNNPSNKEFFDTAFGYAGILLFITFLSSLAVIRGIFLFIAAMLKATYGKTHLAFFVFTGLLAAAFLILLLYLSFV